MYDTFANTRTEKLLLTHKDVWFSSVPLYESIYLNSFGKYKFMFRTIKNKNMRLIKFRWLKHNYCKPS